MLEVATAVERYGAAQVAQFYESGRWRRETLTDLLRERAAEDPDRVVVDDGSGTLTVTELHEQSIALAEQLRRLGVQPQDTVSVQLPNWREFAVIVAAVTAVGGVVVPIMPIYRREDVAYVLRDAGVKVAFTAAEFRGFDFRSMYDDLRSEVESLRSVVLVRSDGAPGEFLNHESLVSHRDAGGPAPESVLNPDLPWVIVYSSGTTSRPKGCVHSFNTIAGAARLLAATLGYGPDDVVFGPAPITHTQGLINALLVPLVTGARTRILESWTPAAAAEAIDAAGCTVAMSVPAMLRGLLDDPAVAQADLGTIRVWVVSGSAVPPELLRQASARMPGARLLSAYGRSENITTTICRPDDPDERTLDSDGRSLEGNQVRIVAEDGSPLPPGEEGDIAFLGCTHMLGYLGMPEETAALFTPDGFSMSGDLGVMDENGFVRVTGRTKDIVIRGGMNISVRQVEDLLLEHPAVQQAAVVGMPDERLGERLCCFAIVDDGEPLTLDDLRSHLLDRGLAIQKVPEHLELVTDIPVNALGKVQKNELRLLAAKIATG